MIGEEFTVLGTGKVKLLDVMGCDADIADAARISYGKGTRSISDNRALIRYLIRHGHTSPLEMAEMKFFIRLPMDIWRQMIRHRAAKFSNINEYSTRYSEVIDDCSKTKSYDWRLQSDVNKQGSKGGEIKWPEQGYDFAKSTYESPGSFLTDMETIFQEQAREVYEERLAFGIAREQARKDIPLSNFTEVFFKCDVHNLLHFLKLRLDSHAQLEIRQIAEIMGFFVQKMFPITYEAFEDYTLNSITLSALESTILYEINVGHKDTAKSHAISYGWFDKPNNRERLEFEKKLESLGVLNYEW
jgi:thymidylate synthase (FAD)